MEVKTIAICGFCKQPVDIHTFSKKNKTANSCIEEEDWCHWRAKSFMIKMLSCPNCGSVLGFLTLKS